MGVGCVVDVGDSRCAVVHFCWRGVLAGGFGRGRLISLMSSRFMVRAASRVAASSLSSASSSAIRRRWLWVSVGIGIGWISIEEAIAIDSVHLQRLPRPAVTRRGATTGPHRRQAPDRHDVGVTTAGWNADRLPWGAPVGA